MIVVTGNLGRRGWTWAPYSDEPVTPRPYFAQGQERASFTYEIQEGRKVDIQLSRSEIEAALRCFKPEETPGFLECCSGSQSHPPHRHASRMWTDSRLRRPGEDAETVALRSV